MTPFEEVPPHSILRGKRIAVVEDEAPIGMILGIMLDELGCVHAGSAKTLSEALTMSQGVEADAVLLDYRLKGELSEPAAKCFLDRGIKVVLTTGADVRDLPETFKACAVVQKPFGLETIERGLVQAFGGVD